MALTQPELLRHVNQEIENLWLSRLRLDDRLPVVCECSDSSCIVIVDATLGTFQEAVDRGLFLVVAGHKISGCCVIGAGEGWELLERGPDSA